MTPRLCTSTHKYTHFRKEDGKKHLPMKHTRPKYNNQL